MMCVVISQYICASLIVKVSIFRDRKFSLLSLYQESRCGKLHFLFYYFDWFLQAVSLTTYLSQTLLAVRIKHFSPSLSPPTDVEFAYCMVLLLMQVFQQLLKICRFPMLILFLLVGFSQGLRKLHVLPKVPGIFDLLIFESDQHLIVLDSRTLQSSLKELFHSKHAS